MPEHNGMNMAVDAKTDCRKQAIEPLVLIASFFMFFWVFTYDVSIIPDGIENGFSLVIPIATSCGIVFLIALALLTMFRPSALPVRALTIGSLCCAALGALCVWLSSSVNPLLYYLGMSFIDICFEWALVTCCLALSLLKPRQAFIHIASAVIAAYILANLMKLVPLSFSWILFVVCPPLVILLLTKSLSGVFASTRESLPLVEVRITKPYTWLPVTNKIFVSFLFFMGIFGYIAQTEKVGVGVVPALLVVVVVGALFLVMRRKFDMNLPYQIASLFVLLSMLLSPVSGEYVQIGESLALSVSAVSFYFFQTLILTTMAARSQRNGVSFVAFGNAIGLLGSVIGSLVGYFASLAGVLDRQALYLGAIFIVIVYIAFVIIGLKNVNFTDIIMDIDTSTTTTSLPLGALRKACEKTAATYGLTKRETEVLELLARGRNTEIIERELVISRNTVKTHARHIYEKLDCHKQQELIDIVEGML